MILQVFRTNLRGVSFIDVLSLPMKNYSLRNHEKQTLSICISVCSAGYC